MHVRAHYIVLYYGAMSNGHMSVTAFYCWILTEDVHDTRYDVMGLRVYSVQVSDSGESPPRRHVRKNFEVVPNRCFRLKINGSNYCTEVKFQYIKQNMNA